MRRNGKKGMQKMKKQTNSVRFSSNRQNNCFGGVT